MPGDVSHRRKQRALAALEAARRRAAAARLGKQVGGAHWRGRWDRWDQYASAAQPWGGARLGFGFVPGGTVARQMTRAQVGCR